MQAKRLLTAALAAIILFLSLGSCKKSDDNPNPKDSTTTTLSCKPILQLNTTDNERTHTYQYDAQGRVVKSTELVFNGTRNEEWPTDITYDGEDVILHRRQGTSSSSAIVLTRYRIQSGKVFYYATGTSLSALTDTVHYRYAGGQLIKIHYPHDDIYGFASPPSRGGGYEH